MNFIRAIEGAEAAIVMSSLGLVSQLAFFWLMYTLASINWDRTRVPFCIFVASFFGCFGIFTIRTLVSLFYMPTP